MSTKKLGSVLGKTVLFASVVSVSLLTTVSISLLATTTSASPIAPGFDLSTLNDALDTRRAHAVAMGKIPIPRAVSGISKWKVPV